MALPIDYDTVTVRGKYVYLDGSPARGLIRFTGKVIATSAATKTMIIPATVTATLDENGQFTVPVPATNDPDIQPNGWTYSVSEDLSNGGGRVYDIDIPLEAKPDGIDLSAVAPVIPANGNPTAFVTLTAYEELSQRVGVLEQSGGGTAGVTSVNTRTGAVTLAKGDVGLSNVDNTSDANKPVSTAQQTALNAKVDKATLTAKGDLYAATAASTVTRLGLGTNGQGLVVDTTTPTGMKWADLVASNAVTSVAGRTGAVVLTKSDVGLANVDNTSDANKPVSTATQAAINAKANDNAVVKLAPGAQQIMTGDGTFTIVRGEVPYSAADTNADQWAFFNRNAANTAWLRITWLNGNFEFRSMPSTANRVGFRAFEFAEASGGPSIDEFAQFSTNPPISSNRESLLAVRGTGAATLPGWVTVSRGIDAPNIKPEVWTAVTLGAATNPTATYETPSSRLEPNGTTDGKGRTSLKGRIEIPANTSSGTALFTIADADHRPAKTRGFSVRTGGGNLACIMEINSAGVASLNVASGASASWLYLDNITFAL